jgi:hypothetical protein
MFALLLRAAVDGERVMNLTRAHFHCCNEVHQVKLLALQLAATL